MDQRIQELEARLFCKTLEAFYDNIYKINKKDFEGEFANIRNEYLDELEKM